MSLYLARGISLSEYCLFVRCSCAIFAECLSVSACTKQSGVKQSSRHLIILTISVVCPPDPRTAQTRTFRTPRRAWISIERPRRINIWIIRYIGKRNRNIPAIKSISEDVHCEHGFEGSVWIHKEDMESNKGGYTKNWAISMLYYWS